jgi:hypothetical protein
MFLNDLADRLAWLRPRKITRNPTVELTRRRDFIQASPDESS